MREKLRFGICGLGFMGRTHFGHLRGHAQACVTAVCDRNAERRAGRWGGLAGNIGGAGRDQADMTGVSQYETPEALLADPAVDAVLIALPTPEHAAVAERALRIGKHVLCEKPMAPDLAGCDRMLAAARDSGRTLMIAQCIRFWPAYEHVARLVRAGRLGRLRFLKLMRIGSPPGYSSGNWLMDGRQSGGALLDLHVHDVDFVLSLLGPPARLSAAGLCGPSGEIDHVFASYDYADGVLVQIEGSWLYRPPRPFEMALCAVGETASAEWSSRTPRELLLYAGDAEAQRIDCGADTGWPREVDYFIECVRSGRPPERCLPESSRMSIAVTLMERESIEAGGKLIALR